MSDVYHPETASLTHIAGSPPQSSSSYFAKKDEFLSLLRIIDLFLIYIKAQVKNWTMQCIYYFTLLFILV